MLLTTAAAIAQSLKINAPSHVAAGEQFKLTYTVDTKDASGFQTGKFPDGVEVLWGPSTSTQSSFQMVNGHVSSSSSITYTYVLVIDNEGSYTLPAASVSVGGKKVNSKTVAVNCSGTSPQAQHQQRHQQGQQQQQQQQQQRQQPAQVQDAGTPISSKQLFITVHASKSRVYEQEPILLTYKVYTLVDLTQLEGKMPDLKGFHTQEIPLPQQKSFHTETYNGRTYNCVTWSQYVMYPQMTGKLEIPPLTFKGIVVQRNKYVDPFEAFFNGGSGYVEVRKDIQAPGLTVQVDPLPQKPADFSGGVGHLNISAQVDKTTLDANDPVNLRVVVSGTGNLKLIKQPTVKWPADFDTYDAKVTDKTKLTTAGLNGNVVYDFLAVPRHQGKFTVPPVELTYFDLATKSYKTLRTESIELTVNKGKGGGGSTVSTFGGEDVKLLNKDIRYIKQGDAPITEKGSYFFGSKKYLAILAVLVAAFIALFSIFRQRAINNANLTRQKGKKANKVATKRLRNASKMMLQNRRAEFYDEVMRTLWGYVGDKLNIPVAQLSKENIADKLAERNVTQENIDAFNDAINECEFQRYAPGSDGGDMEKVFTKAMDAITKIDSQLGKKGYAKTSATTIIMLLAFAASFAAMPAQAAQQAQDTTQAAPMPDGIQPEVDDMDDMDEATAGAPKQLNADTTKTVNDSTAMAITKAAGDSAYAKEHYQEAIDIYEALLKQGENSDIHFNLGNAYYRIDNIPMAVLNYERALLLSPGDGDIRFNLQLARGKTIDKITPEGEFIFATWYRSIVNLMSVDGWAETAIVCLIIALLLALVYLFADKVGLRKLGFFGGITLLVAFLLCNLFAFQQKSRLENRTGAIIMAPSVTVKSTPSNSGTDVFVLHEGTRVDIVDAGMKEWREIKLADGKRGWITSNAIEII